VADTLKVLGQLAPSATTDTTLYTVPSITSTTTSSLVICNRSAGALTYRVAVRPLGAAIANKHYIYYNKTLAANESFAAILGMTLDSADVVTVYASSGDLSFTLFGVETDQT
tara:strand:- start:1787 stop:2122 length:336 start_codon:yes stop_codon:yes gene_type:complete